MGLALILGGAFAQYFHGSLHRERNPPVVRWMRRCGLLMTPEAHQLHHDTLQRDFATNSGWSNPLINRLFVALRSWGYLKDEGLEPQS
jgi:sterol desaturase/sphingolipid hydroxylase (fatty acid hydroxylase superfamily)